MASTLPTLFAEFKHLSHREMPAPLAFPLQLKFDRVLISVEHDPLWPDLLLIHSSLGVIPAGRRLEVYRILLEANLFWSGTTDATIGVDPASQEATVAYRFDFREMAAKDLMAMLEQFALLAELWRQFVALPVDAKAKFLSHS